MKGEELLLNDVLRAGDYEKFQESVREAMIAEARASRAAQRTGRWLALAACVAVVGVGLFWSRDGERLMAEKGSAVWIVRSEAMPMGMVVRTEAPTEGPLEVVRSEETVAQLKTVLEPVVTVTDEQLLALFKDRPMALVRVGPDLRLVTPGDLNGTEQQ